MLKYRIYSIISSRVLIGMRTLEKQRLDETQQSRPLTALVFQSLAVTRESTIIIETQD